MMRPGEGSAAAGMICWISVQLLGLALIAGHVLLTGKGLLASDYPFELLLALQLITSAALLPALFVTVSRAALCFAIAFVTLQVGGILAGQSALAGFVPAGSLLLWCAALACWGRIPRHFGQAILISCGLCIWVVGTAGGYYLVREFQPRPMLEEALGLVSPLLTENRLWLQMVHLLVAGGAATIFSPTEKQNTVAD